jgi:hypothetical protein
MTRKEFMEIAGCLWNSYREARRYDDANYEVAGASVIFNVDGRAMTLEIKLANRRPPDFGGNTTITSTSPAPSLDDILRTYAGKK